MNTMKKNKLIAIILILSIVLVWRIVTTLIFRSELYANEDIFSISFTDYSYIISENKDNLIKLTFSDKDSEKITEQFKYNHYFFHYIEDSPYNNNNKGIECFNECAYSFNKNVPRLTSQKELYFSIYDNTNNEFNNGCDKNYTILMYDPANNSIYIFDEYSIF